MLKRSFIGKHWRGELSLPVSYWLIGFLGNIVVLVIVGATDLFFREYTPVAGLIFTTTYWLSVLSVILWQIVGVWRSSNNHVDRGGRQFWAIAAKVMMVFAIIQSYALLTNNVIPQVKEAAHIALGDKRIGKASFRIVNAGQEIELVGGIKFGTTERLAEVLSAAPSIRVIHLNSHGGRIGEAVKLRNLIRQYGLWTVTTGKCESACTISFLGGKQRFLHPQSGQLGFHAATLAGVSQRDAISANSEIVSDLVKFGVSRNFAEKTVKTKQNDMWYPTHKELFEANYITALSSGQFALTGFGGKPTSQDIVNWLNKIPIYQAIRSVDENRFHAISNLIIKGMVQGLPENQVFGATRGMLSELILARLPMASSDALFEMLMVLMEEMKVLNEADPSICRQFVAPKKGEFVDLRNYLSRSLLKRDLSASEKVIISSLENHKNRTSQKELEVIFEKVLLRLISKQGKGFVEDLEKLGTSKAGLKTCQISITFYQEILKLPKSQAVEVFRMILSEA